MRRLSNLTVLHVKLARSNTMSNADILKEHTTDRTKVVVYSRVMGYTIPVERFNIGKQGEHKERKYFKECSEA